MVKQRYDWEFLAQDFLTSGLALKRWAEQRNIPYSTARNHITINQVHKSSGALPDWGVIKSTYMTSSRSLSSIAREFGFSPSSGGFRRQTKGWAKDRAKMRQENAKKEKMRLDEKMSIEAQDVFALAQKRAIEGLHCIDHLDALLKTRPPTTLKEAKQFASCLKDRAQVVAQTQQLLRSYDDSQSKAEKERRQQEKLLELLDWYWKERPDIRQVADRFTREQVPLPDFLRYELQQMGFLEQELEEISDFKRRILEEMQKKDSLIEDQKREIAQLQALVGEALRSGFSL